MCGGCRIKWSLWVLWIWLISIPASCWETVLGTSYAIWHKLIVVRSLVETGSALTKGKLQRGKLQWKRAASPASSMTPLLTVCPEAVSGIACPCYIIWKLLTFYKGHTFVPSFRPVSRSDFEYGGNRWYYAYHRSGFAGLISGSNCSFS